MERTDIKMPKNIFSHGVSQNDKNSVYTKSFNVSEEKEWVGQYKKIWSKLELQLFQKLVTEPIKGEGRCVYGKLKTWKECIKTNFHGREVPCDMNCNATAVLKIGFIYKQGNNYHPQVHIEECKYTDAENQRCNMLMMMMDFLRCKKEGQKSFL